MHIEKKELPERLKRARPSGWSCDIADGSYLTEILVGLNNRRCNISNFILYLRVSSFSKLCVHIF